MSSTAVRGILEIRTYVIHGGGKPPMARAGLFEGRERDKKYIGEGIESPYKRNLVHVLCRKRQA